MTHARNGLRGTLPGILLVLACACTPLAPRAGGFADAAAAPTTGETFLFGLHVAEPARLREAALRYAQLTSPRAQAIAITRSGDYVAGESGGRTHELGAVDAAVAACEVARVQAGIASPCEVHRLDDETFEPGLATRIRTRADDPTTPAHLWRFRHGDAVLYVAGSMHAQRATVLPLAAALDAAYREADALYVEVDMAQVSQARMLEVARRVSLLPEGQTLEAVLAPDVRAAMHAAATRLGVPWTQLLPMRPGSALSVLSVAALTTIGLDPGNGVEALLLSRARADGKAIVGIERYEDQVALLADAPAGTDAIAAAGLAPPALRAGMLALFDAWMRADDAAILRAFTGGAEGTPHTGAGPEDAAAAWTRRLLDVRNEHMAAQAAERLRSGAGTALLVVGAGHLPGPHGVIARLAAAGFRGEQLTRGGLSVPRPPPLLPTIPPTIPPTPSPPAGKLP